MNSILYINFQNFSKNVHVLYIQHTRLLKKKKVHNFVYSKYTKFQRIYIILFIQWTQIFKEYTQLCTFNVYFQRMYIICMFIVHFFFFFLIECAQFCTFNVHNFSKNICNSIYSMYTIVYIQCTQSFQKIYSFFFSFNIKA